MEINPAPRLAPNWTTAAGALEGVLDWLGAPLPRHAIMGLTGHAWHACLAARQNVVALPEGAVALDWGAMVARYERTGVQWERFAARAGDGITPADVREAAIAWMRPRLAEGRPIIGFDFHLHEFGIVYGLDEAAQAFLVHSVLSDDLGPRVPFGDWPSTAGIVELFAPGQPAEVDARTVVVDSLRTAVELFDGGGPADGQPRGTQALEAWADAFAGDLEVDRAGNAYLLAVVQAARLDGADYLRDVAANFPEVSTELLTAERALRDEAHALAPLLTLFPFPAGGHGNVANRALRDTAAMALRRAAHEERRARDALAAALRQLPVPAD